MCNVGVRRLLVALFVSVLPSAARLEPAATDSVEATHHKHHHKHHHNHHKHAVRLNQEPTAASIVAPPSASATLNFAAVGADLVVESGAPLPPTLNTTLRLLNESQYAMDALKASIDSINTRLGGAENVIVGSAENVSHVREYIYKLKEEASTNKGYLWDLARYDSKLNGTLDFDNLEVAQTGPALSGTAKAAKKMADATKSLISDAELEKLRKLNDKLWAATDPSKPNSIDKTDDRVQEGLKKVKVFDDEMGVEIKKMAVKQLRRGGNKLRKALRHLTRVAGGEAVDRVARDAGQRDGGLEGLRDN